MSSRTFMIINLAVSGAAIAFLFWLIYVRKGGGDSATLSFLPAVNAALNATTTAFLIRGWFAIRAGDRALHAFCQKTAFIFSSLFLVCYIIHHSLHGDTRFTGEGWIKSVYFTILISHILLSIVALPMVLATFFFAITQRFATHRKLARVTFPLWLYVSITGVLIFAFLKVYT
jgi:putative membrane protein